MASRTMNPCGMANSGPRLSPGVAAINLGVANTIAAMISAAQPRTPRIGWMCKERRPVMNADPAKPPTLNIP